MTKTEIYQEHKLISSYESNLTINGIVYSVYVYPINPSSENDLCFIEKTSITRYAMKRKYDSFEADDALQDIEKITFSKAKARIALDFYEKGEEFFQEISLDSLDNMIKTVDDEVIQRHILEGLFNIRKKNPRSYTNEFLNPEGFCYLLGISFNQYLFNVGFLKEDGYIERGPSKQFSFENGGMFITSLGARNLSRLLTPKSVAQQALKINSSSNDIVSEYQYDIALSFAGEDRQIAELLANELHEKGIRVFYDDFEESKLWGKNLYEHLSHIYSESARYCIMLLSSNYASKSWTNHERQSAQARAFREQQEYILPIKLDDTKIPGIIETVGYISFNDHSIEEIVELILRKLKTQ